MNVKIAITSNDGKQVAAHFGRTKGFVICELEDKKIKKQEYRPNTFTAHARGLEGRHGMGHHRQILEALSDCQVIISGGMGQGMYDALKAAGKEVFIIAEKSIEKVLDLYLSGQLTDKPEMKCNPKCEKRTRIKEIKRRQK
jgi:predicted Fe-Mo cluster-binding NifX family protein